MTSALWTGCGLVTKCRGERQARRRGGSISGHLERPGCSPDRRASAGGGRVVHAQFGAPRKPGQLVRRSHYQGTGLAPRGRKHKPRHMWIWNGKGYLHLEPQGRREVAPGQFQPYTGKTLGRLRGWHVTPPDLRVVHPPPPPHRGIKPGYMVPGRPIHHAGHYGYSPVLGRHAWIGSHDTLSLHPSQLPPSIRGPVMKAIKAAANLHPQAHTAWGVTGHRVQVIPGHWVHAADKTWKYVERHVDKFGRVMHVTYPQTHAPSAAFGTRPRYLPPLHFWPDPTGTMRNGHGAPVLNAPKTVTLPPHARFAQQAGLVGPVYDRWAANFARRAFGEVNSATSRDVLGRPQGGGLLRQAKRQGAIS